MTEKKNMGGAMKFLQSAVIGTMLLSVGSTYAFNPAPVAAETNQTYSDSEFAKMTETFSNYSYDDVRADHPSYSSIQWATEHGLFDSKETNFHPSKKVSEALLVNVLANYFKLDGKNVYKEFAKYQVSLNAYNDTSLSNKAIKKGQFAQVVAELAGERGTLEDSIKFLDDKGVVDVEEEDGIEIADLYGAELSLSKAEFATLLQKMSNRNITLSDEIKEIYASNSNKSEKDLYSSIDDSNAISLIGTCSISNEGEITSVSRNLDDIFEEADKVLTQNNRKQDFFKNLEKTNPPKKGDKIKSYKEQDNDYVSGTKYYVKYTVYWKSGKKTTADYHRGTATNAERNMYSTKGNKVDNKVVISSKQKAIIKKLKAKYGNKYRYYVSDYAKPDIGLIIVPNDGKTFKYHMWHSNSLVFFNAKYFSLDEGQSGTKASMKRWFNLAYDIGFFPKVGTKAGWAKRALTLDISGYHGYYTSSGFGLVFQYQGE